jgi:hypothetical protein
MRGARARDESGVVAVIVAACAILLFAAAALVVDLGKARDVRRMAANAADASALAAGNALYLNTGVLAPKFTEAVDAAKLYAANNYGITAAQWAACTDPNALPYVPAGSTPCISFDQLVKPTKVRVRIPVKDVDTPFGSVIGRRKISVSAHAVSKLLTSTKSPCALCILGGGTHDLQNGDATASGGDIAFNGNVSVGANGLVATDGSIFVQGTADGPLANYTPDPVVGRPAIADPLSFVALPPDMSGLTVKTDPCTQGPGKYGSVDLRSRTCTLQPGLYVVAGSSGTKWDLSGNDATQMLGTGVTVYLTCGTPATPVVCTSGQSGATFDASGNASLGFTAPSSGPMQGLAIVMDRNNSATFRLAGQGASGLTGTIYMPAGTIEMNGNGCATIDALIVTKDLAMNGNPACLISDYLPSQNVEFQPGSLQLSE